MRIIARLNIGGPAIHTVLLSEGLDKARFDSLLVCGSTDNNEGDMSYYARDKNITPHLIPELKRELNPIKDLIALVKIYNLIQLESPDIIHTHTAKAGTLGRAAAILYNMLHICNKRRIRLVHTFHGHIFEGYFNRFTTALFIHIERFLACFTDTIITVSTSVKDDLVSLRIAGKDKIKVIPLGFELKGLLDIPPYRGESLNIGIIGRLVPIKNHHLFLEAAGKIIHNYPSLKASFYIVGDGNLRKELEDFCSASGISARVHFLGWKEDLAVVYSSLDMVCLTSLNEGTPVSLIEAMASGRAVVATDAGGVRDLLGNKMGIDYDFNSGFSIMERGILVNKNSADAFSAALLLMSEDSRLRRDMGLRGRAFVKELFSKDRLIADIDNLYRILMNDPA